MTTVAAFLGGSATTTSALVVAALTFAALAAWTMRDYRAWSRDRDEQAAKADRQAAEAREAWHWPRRDDR